ncbi:hypothetical protein HA40_03090 [Mixta calida]|nr:hypothetical protein HA40_03090 [Mixta calida]
MRSITKRSQRSIINFQICIASEPNRIRIITTGGITAIINRNAGVGINIQSPGAGTTSTNDIIIQLCYCIANKQPQTVFRLNSAI